MDQGLIALIFSEIAPKSAGRRKLGQQKNPRKAFLLVIPLEIPSADLFRNSYRRVSKNGFRRAILARFCFSVRLSARTKRVSTKGASMIRAISEFFLRNCCIKCPKLGEIWPLRGYLFCGYRTNLCPPKTFAMWLFWGVFWASFLLFSYIKGPKHAQKKSYSKCFRRTQIRWVIWRSSNVSP